MRTHSQITGWGKYLPAKVLTNQELEGMLDTTDEWIRTRTGIIERRVAGPKEYTSSMATRAAHAALETAGVSPRKVDLIICATDTPDYLYPATACLVQDALGASHAAAFDIEIGCPSFVYGLAIADAFIAAGTYKTVLVVGAELMSRILDYSDRTTAVLFGDGAGAVLLERSENENGMLAFVLGSDGSGADLLYQPAGGSRLPPSAETVQNNLHYLRMNGNEVYKFAVGIMVKATRQVLAKARLRMDEIKLLIPHQANMRIIDSATKALKIPADRVFINVDKVGNTSSAAIAIALVEAVETGRVNPGDNVVLVSFGAGLSWAAAALRWGVEPVAVIPRWRKVVFTFRDIRAAIRSWLRRQRRRLWARLFPNGSREESRY